MRSDPLTPPGSTTRVEAERVLCLAPHPDDEVLGCGGLLAGLADRGTRISVLFLTDGAGQPGESERPEEYAARRSQEAREAAEVLGISHIDEAGCPDGELHRHLSEAAGAIRGSIETVRPDLVLVPSPLEASRDHRAAFGALWEVLGTTREGDDLDRLVAGVEILVYEVNHPSYPDVLVDVSDEIGRIEEAMGCYRSQQERHDYLGAALGIKKLRALSLPREVELAEGFSRLRVEDFRTRSPSRLVSDLGGVPRLMVVEEGPGVSVVVRTRDRPELLAEALESIAGSTYRRLDVVLVNDGGEAPAVPGDFPFPIREVVLGGEGRAAAANAGIEAAASPWIAFLDDDDVVEPEHFATLVDAVSAPGVTVAYSDAAVGVYELGGDGGWIEVERRLPYSRDFDPDLLLVDNYIPFNTVLLPADLVREVGPLDPELPFFEDWDFLIRLSRRTPFHHLRRVTCEYRHFRGGGHVLGERPRERRDFLAMKERVVGRHREALSDEGLARVVDGLRRELVEASEAARSSTRRLEEAEKTLQRVRGEAAALNGEVVGLREEREALREDLQRLYDDERTLRATVRDQESHIGRLYEEVERLNGLLEEMRSTRAWRFHEWLERWRGRSG